MIFEKEIEKKEYIVPEMTIVKLEHKGAVLFIASDAVKTYSSDDDDDKELY